MGVERKGVEMEYNGEGIEKKQSIKRRIRGNKKKELSLTIASFYQSEDLEKGTCGQLGGVGGEE